MFPLVFLTFTKKIFSMIAFFLDWTFPIEEVCMHGLYPIYKGRWALQIHHIH